jgi:hypothetical protein
MEKLTSIQRKNYIKSMIAVSDKWALRALMLVYDNQTSDEQRGRYVDRINGIGFTKSDARLMSVFAQLHKDKGLTENQITQVKLRMPKYWRQVLNSCNIIKLDNLIRKSKVA